MTHRFDVSKTEDEHSLATPSKTYDRGGRFDVQSVHSDDFSEEHLTVRGSIAELSHHSGDNLSIGNHSVFSQLTANLIAAPGNAQPWLADPGSVLGSSVLLASQSYLSIYQSDPEGLDTTARLDSLKEEVEYDDIFDNPEYIDTLEGQLPLAEAARMIAKDSTKHGALFSQGHIRRARSDSYRRVVAIGLAFLFLFTSNYGVRNAFNSLSNDKQLSLVCYGAIYSLLWFGGICSNLIISKVRPKWSLAIATLGFIIYPMSMFYPSYYVTLPASIILGFCVGLLWSVEGVYLMNTAATYSLISGEELSTVVSRFNGIIFSFFYCSNIAGNLLVAMLLGDFYTLPGENLSFTHLQPGVIHTSLHSNVSHNTSEYLTSMHFMSHVEDTNNTRGSVNSSVTATCGLDFYTNTANQTQSTKTTVFIGKQQIFYGVNTLLPVIASIIIIAFLKKLKVTKRPGGGNILKTMVLVGKTIADKRSLLIIPTLFNLGTLASVILADYSTAFISCAYGADKIGYVMMTAFLFSAVGAFISGQLVKLIGRPTVFLISMLTGASSALCLLLVTPEGDKITPITFIPTCLWALSDGILLTQCNGLLAMMFRQRITQALTMLSSCMSIGALFSTFSIAINLFSLTTKIYYRKVAPIGACVYR